MVNRVEQLQRVQDEACALFTQKNADYGDAFASYGPIGVLMRMGDKLARLQSITKAGVTLIDSESLRDSLIDLHNYSAMAVMLLDEGNDLTICQNEICEPPLHIDEDLLKDVLFRDVPDCRTEAMRLGEIASSVCDCVCGRRLDLETCKTLVSAALDTYSDCDVATAYLAVALRMAHEGLDVLHLDAALRAKEPIATIQGSSPNLSSSVPEGNIIVAEAGIGAITQDSTSYGA